MTKTFKHRILALLLALVCVVTTVPLTALAAELPEDEAHIECSCEDCEIPEGAEEPADISDAYVIGEDTQAAEITPEPETESEPEQAEEPIPEPEAVPVQEQEEEPAPEPASEPEVSASGLMWELNDGLLFIYGSGEITPFASAEEQPWRDRRDEIIEVMFDESADMTIESLAYWFAGCTNLTRADLPDYICEIGYHAFHDCHALHDVMLCCQETPKLIPGAFITDHPLEWEVNYDPHLQFTVLNAGVMYDLCDYDWTEDGTPVHIRVQAPVRLLAAAAPAAKAAPMLAASASGYCSSCKTTCPYTLDYEQWTDDIHCVRHWCSNCGKDQCGGVLGEDHTYNNSGYCSKCGYYNSDYDYSVCYHTRTRTYWDGCDWEEYCRDCGELLDWGTSHGSTYTVWEGCYWYDYCRDCGELMDSGVSHDYSYGDWEYYNTTRHRRLGTCDSCGATTYTYGNHSKKNTAVPYSSTQHQYGSYCATCQSFIGSVSYQNHTFTYGSWQSYNGTQHRRLRTCSACGYSDYEYANHSLSYGSWTSANAIQHKRTVTCSCGYSTTEYADHSLTVTRQSISDTQHKVTSKCSTCGYTTTANEAHTFTYGEWQSYSDTQHRRTKSCACGYSGYDYGDHTDANGDGTCDNCGYLMSHFSVTVPAGMVLTVSETGEVYAAQNAQIVNNSTAAVAVTEINLSVNNGWKIVPYATNMASAKVNSKLIGFRINNAQTSVTGNSEAFDLRSGWRIEKDAALPLDYDAVVSAMSRSVTNEQVLTVVFIVEWA